MDTPTKQLYERTEQVQKAVLGFVNLFNKLPKEAFDMYFYSNEERDAVYKPLCEELYIYLTENQCSVDDMDKALDIFENVANMTYTRCGNYLNETIKYVYADLLGHGEPAKNMPIGEWEKRRFDIANKPKSE